MLFVDFCICMIYFYHFSSMNGILVQNNSFNDLSFADSLDPFLTFKFHLKLQVELKTHSLLMQSAVELTN